MGKVESIGGLELSRLQYPKAEDVNEDFLCGICKSKSIYRSNLAELVLNPIECSNR